MKKFHEFYKNVLSAQNKFLFGDKLSIKTETALSIYDEDSDYEHAEEHQEGEVFHEELQIFGSDNETPNLSVSKLENTIDDSVDDSDPDFQALDHSDQSESGRLSNST